MKFELNEYIDLKTTDDFYDYVEFLIEELEAEIETYYINNGKDVEINNDGVIIVNYLWIKPQNITIDNISKIINVAKHLEEHANVEITIADINIR